MTSPNLKPARAAREEVGALGHRLHAAGHHDLGVAGLDHLVGQVDGVEARQAHLVDGGGGTRHRDAGVDGRLAGGDLPGTGLEDLAHEHVVDVLGRDPGPLEGGLDGEATELGGGEAGEGAGAACRSAYGRRRGSREPAIDQPSVK